MSAAPSLSELADELEHRQMEDLGERVVINKSLLFHLSDGERTLGPRVRGRRQLMGEDPRLPPMPEKPTLLDYFRLRFAPSQAHLLQSANLAQKNGCRRRWCSRACSTTSRWWGSSAPTTATGARSLWSRTSTRR